MKIKTEKTVRCKMLAEVFFFYRVHRSNTQPYVFCNNKWNKKQAQYCTILCINKSMRESISFNFLFCGNSFSSGPESAETIRGHTIHYIVNLGYISNGLKN